MENYRNPVTPPTGQPLPPGFCPPPPPYPYPDNSNGNIPFPDIPQVAPYNTYIGARYVPLFDGEWDESKQYEPLTVVTYQNNSYTSMTYVQPGIIPGSPQGAKLWALTGNYNAHIGELSKRIQSNTDAIANFQDEVDEIGSQIPSIKSKIETNTTDINNLKTDNENQKTLNQNINHSITNINQSINSINEKNNAQDTTIGNLSNKATENQTNISNHTNQLNRIESDITTIQDLNNKQSSLINNMNKYLVPNILVYGEDIGLVLNDESESVMTNNANKILTLHHIILKFYSKTGTLHVNKPVSIRDSYIDLTNINWVSHAVMEENDNQYAFLFNRSQIINANFKCNKYQGVCVELNDSNAYNIHVEGGYEGVKTIGSRCVINYSNITRLNNDTIDNYLEVGVRAFAKTFIFNTNINNTIIGVQANSTVYMLNSYIYCRENENDTHGKGRIGVKIAHQNDTSVFRDSVINNWNVLVATDYSYSKTYFDNILTFNSNIGDIKTLAQPNNVHDNLMVLNSVYFTNQVNTVKPNTTVLIRGNGNTDKNLFTVGITPSTGIGTLSINIIRHWGATGFLQIVGRASFNNTGRIGVLPANLLPEFHNNDIVACNCVINNGRTGSTLKLASVPCQIMMNQGVITLDAKLPKSAEELTALLGESVSDIRFACYATWNI